MAKRIAAKKRGPSSARRDGRAAAAARPRAAAVSPDEPSRRDDDGQLWTRDAVDAEVRAIVAELAGLDASHIQRDTRYHDDLDWDGWFVLSVVKPIRKRLHEDLADGIVLQLETVGDLADYVWSRMEVVP